MPKTSIQRRLIAAVVLSQILLAVGVFAVAVFFTHRQLRAGFDAGLQGRAMTILALVRYSEDERPKLGFERDMVPPPLEAGRRDLFQVIGPHGELLAQSDGWPDHFSFQTDDRDRTHSDFTVQGVRYRAVRLQDVAVLDREGDEPTSDKLQIIYASPVAPMARAVGHLRQTIALGCAVALCITVPLAVWGLRRGLRPLANLAANAATISPSNWELNPAEEALDTAELAPLTKAMTAMLDGLHRAFLQQREFLANAAHELKTPVAILKSTLQSLAQRPRSSEEYRMGLEEALQDMERLEKLLHSMLRLARAEQWASGSLHRHLAEIDIRSTCENACVRLQPLARERGVNVHLNCDGPMPMRADGEDLELVWSNLLENAIRFSPGGGTVELNLHANSWNGTVEVTDQGPGIPEDELPRMFERFHRGDESRARSTGGYGLGLAIAKALVEAYRGTITVENRAPQGTRMKVRLPMAVDPRQS